MRRRILAHGSERESLLRANNHGFCKGYSKKGTPSSWPMYSLVSSAAVACYLNGLNGDFVHDDIPAVTFNRDVTGENPISHVFRNDFWGTPMADLASHKSYRPLTTLTFRFNYWCFGLQPFWFHATNILLHAVASVLFTRVALRIAGMKAPFATLAGLLFAIHPIHTEAVTGIVGRADVLACVFFLASLLAYHGGNNEEYLVWRSIIFGSLSMMSKETGITIFVVNLAFDFYKSYHDLKRTIVEVRWNKETKDFAERAVKLLISLGILLVIRLAILQGSLPKFSQQDNPTAFHSSVYVRILTFCYLAAINWWLLICPATLSHDWQMGSIPLVTSIHDSRNIVTCFFFTLVVLILIRSIVDLESQKHVPVVLGLMLLLLPFLPAANLFVTVGFVIAERVLYIPSLGCILLVIYGVQILWNSYSKHRQTILCFIILLLTTSCLRTIVRNRDWRSRESLLRAGLMTLPHNAKMHYNYANFLRDSARPELAKSHYHTALKLWPTYASAHNNLGTLLSNEQEAEAHFLAAIRYSSDHVNAHYNLGQLYRKANKTLKSEKMLMKCLRIEPRFTPAYIELARLIGPENRKVGPLLKKVMELNKKDPYYGCLYARWLFNRGNTMESQAVYLKVLRHSPYQEAIIGLFKIMRKNGCKSRLFQILTRWQSIQRVRKGEQPLSPHVYLQGWQLKTELYNKAKAYDNCPSIILEKTRCIDTSSKINITNNINKWNNLHKHKTNCSAKIIFSSSKQCKLQSSKNGKNEPVSQMLVHHLLDSV